MITFVSCIFDELPDNNHKNKEIQTKYSELVSKWQETKVFLKIYVKDYFLFEYIQRITENSTNIKIELLADIRTEEWACKIDLDKCVLPENRNKEKDTMEHIWNTLHKYPCLAKCARENPFQTTHYAYMDFDAFHLFHDPRTMGYLKEHFGQTNPQTNKQLFMENPRDLYIPGCWGKLE